jgi:hypothetical protein
MDENRSPESGSVGADAMPEMWTRELFSVADALRRTGRHRRLRDVTIVLPIDHVAVEAIELACQALSGGELSPAANELDQFFVRLSQDQFAVNQFLPAVRGVACRVGQGDRPS